MKARITVLCENTVGALIGTGEHGFAAFRFQSEDADFPYS